MQQSLLQYAFILAGANYFVCLIDNLLAWDATWRPLFFGWLVGTLLGDMKTGLLMGAELEALYMGISAIGGVTASDAWFGTLFPVAWVILTGADKNAALALAVPIGTVLNYINTLTSPIGISLLGLYDKYAAENNQKAYTILHYIYVFLVAPLPRTIVVFIIIYLGIGNLGSITDSMPIWLINGLDVAGGMLVAVGFGILTSMIWSAKLGVFFFVGFVFSEFIGLSTIAIAILAIAIAISMFLINKKIGDISVVAAQSESDEDLF